jgi:hypothetical protein
MAKSPAHKFGQIIGDALEAAIEPLLQRFATEQGLYLDKKGSRPARKGNKVSWIDLYGNKHDLDFVLEKDGSLTQIGIPKAFIETAWRRYTKHSRNKAQEIQGAILPLVTTNHNAAPFIGVILAGVFTGGALAQLRSLGFTVLYFPYDTVVEAFRRVGINAYFDESTFDTEFVDKVRDWEALPEEQHAQVASALLEINSDEVQQFMSKLSRVILREIEAIRLLPLHGTAFTYSSIEEAIKFIENYDEQDSSKSVVKYEIEVRYNNGDRIRGEFEDKEQAIQFLRTYQPLPLRPVQ